MGTERSEKMNFAAALDQSEIHDKPGSLDVVEIDGLVVLKIVKHCKENLPQLVTGQLLGLDFGGTLEVTNCFPFPAANDTADEEFLEEGQEYQYDMMRCLREVNVDNNTVGWYQSTYLGSHITEAMVSTQYNYQESIPKCVCLVWDPLQQAQGKLGIKALRLSVEFMELYKTQEFTLDSISKASLSWEDVFEQVPVSITNSHLLKGWLLQQPQKPTAPPLLRRNETEPFLEKNFECMIESIEQLSQESSRFQYHQRQLSRQIAQQSQFLQKRKAENETRKRSGLPPLSDDDLSNNSLFKPLQEPARFESLLISSQIGNYCNEITNFCGQSFNNHFMIRSLQQETEQ